MRANLQPMDTLASLPPNHGGHGTTESGSSLLHYFLEPVHLPLAICACLLVGAVIWYGWNKRSSKRSS